ncbi:MAG: tetratricopeptide repeat protein [Thermoplasmata archaeon]|nr:tetratricopeptide repeat protein [Thermoplasmata archaeon]
MSWTRKLAKIKEAYEKVVNVYYYVRDGVKKVKEKPVLDKAARFALGAIPGVGTYLQKWYEEAGGSDEEKTGEILKFLASLQEQNEDQFNRISKDLQTNLDAIINKGTELTALMTERFDEIIVKFGEADQKMNGLDRNVARILQKLKASTPPTKVTELFEVIRHSPDVLPAIFRMDSSEGFAPYEVPYIMERESVENNQDDIYRRLLASGGALLVQSRAGLGKTREVAELAKRLCEEKGWTICVAKGEGDSYLNTPAGFPDELRDRKVLFVFDDLHRRLDMCSSEQIPYAERLNSFLKFFEDAMNSGEMYVVATARTEPQYQEKLRSDTSRPLWRWFKEYELPEFTLTGLQSILGKLTKNLSVDIDETQINRMISNSDKTFRTLLMNVEHARDIGQRLTLDNWRPSQLESWRDRFELACGKWPAAKQVYDTLYLIREVWLPTRFDYVVQLGAKLADTEVTTAAKGLVNMGLLGLRNGQLDAFGDEQLRDSLQVTGIGLPELATHWKTTIEAIRTVVETKSEWIHDLFYLTSRLILANRFKDAESISTMALNRGHDTSGIYTARGLARSAQNNYAGAEEDFTAAIDRGEDDPRMYSQRGVARDQLGDYLGAEEDFTAAIDRGLEDAEAYRVRGVVRVHRSNYVGAEEDFAAAITRDMDNADLYYSRGIARGYQGNNAGAEEDLTAAIIRGRDDAGAYCNRGAVRYNLGNYVGAEEDLTTAIDQVQDAGTYYHRGEARLCLANYPEAEEDFTTAIALGRVDAKVYFFRGGSRLPLGKYFEAEEDFTTAIALGRVDAEVYYSRGVSRLPLGKYFEAEEDFTTAIALGMNDGGVYMERGQSRFHQGKFSEAENDLTEAIARGEDNAEIYWGRYNVRKFRGNYAGAEEDLTATIARGWDDACVYQDRSLINVRLGRIEQARQDCKCAEERAHDDPVTYGCWGNLHLALGEYDKAISRYQSALKGRPNSRWHFEMGLALLFARRFDDAVSAFQKGMTESSPNRIKDALRDIDFWVERHADHAAFPKAKYTIDIIRQQLKTHISKG